MYIAESLTHLGTMQNNMNTKEMKQTAIIHLRRPYDVTNELEIVNVGDESSAMIIVEPASYTSKVRATLTVAHGDDFEHTVLDPNNPEHLQYLLHILPEVQTLMHSAHDACDGSCNNCKDAEVELHGRLQALSQWLIKRLAGEYKPSSTRSMLGKKFNKLIRI